MKGASRPLTQRRLENGLSTSKKGNPPITKWKESDEDGHHCIMNTNEVQALVQSCGLPHLSPEAIRDSMAVAQPHPEIEEPEDFIHEEGLAIARAQRGRGGLPERLQG